MIYQEKVEGQPCPSCQKGMVVKSPKTGKLFCDQKCWLNNQQQQAPQLPKENPNWDKISWGKCKHAYLLEMFKKQSKMVDEPTMEQIEEYCEKWADMSMRKRTEPTLTERDGDIKADSVPF